MIQRQTPLQAASRSGWLTLTLLPAFLPLVIVGCQSPAAARVQKQPTATSPPRIEPRDGSVGRVISVNAALRFVVLDFSLSRQPNPGERLELTRHGTVVGELKTGYHARGDTLEADIVSGTPAPGDEARPVRKAAVGE